MVRENIFFAEVVDFWNQVGVMEGVKIWAGGV